MKYSALCSRIRCSQSHLMCKFFVTFQVYSPGR